MPSFFVHSISMRLILLSLLCYAAQVALPGLASAQTSTFCDLPQVRYLPQSDGPSDEMVVMCIDFGSSRLVRLRGGMVQDDTFYSRFFSSGSPYSTGRFPHDAMPDGGAVVIHNGSILRFTREGMPDNTYGSRGVPPPSLPRFTGSGATRYQWKTDVVGQPDGDVLLVDYQIQRLRPDGSLDTNARVDTSRVCDNPTGSPQTEKVMRANDGTGGFFYQCRSRVTRYTSEGRRDSLYKPIELSDTLVASNSDLEVHVDLSRNRYLVLVNRAKVGGPFVLAYRRDGTLDETFGTRGIARLPRNVCGRDIARIYSMAVLTEGTIVVATTYGGHLARLHSTGAIDAGFTINSTAVAACGDGFWRDSRLDSEPRPTLIPLTGGRLLSVTTEADYSVYYNHSKYGVYEAFTTVSSTAPEAGPVGRLTISVPSPHPVRGASQVRLSGIDAGAHVRAEVFDALGRHVAVLHNSPVAETTLDLGLEATPWSPGLYVVRATVTGNGSVSRTVVVR